MGPAPQGDAGFDMSGIMPSLSQMNPLAQVNTAVAFQSQINLLDQNIRDLAKQYPAFAPFAEKLMATLMEAMVTVISNLREPQMPQPNTL